MADLIKMDMYRLFRTKVFYVMLGAVTAACFATNVLAKVLTDLFSKTAEGAEAAALYPASVDLSDILASPFAFSALFILVFISLISFTYADIANGFVKNVAGQLPHKGDTVISKFAVTLVHNSIFTICAALGSVAGELTVRTVTVDSQTGSGVATMIAKILLLQSLSAVILFVTTGLKSKTFASVVGVIISTGLLGVVYFGIETLLENLFKVGVNISDYAPDQLLTQAGQAAFGNACLVSFIVSALFIVLTVKVFNRRDVK